MSAMASAVRGMSAVYHKEGTDPGECHVHHASVFVNDDESGLHHDYEVWLEELAPHAPIDQAGPGAGCTTAPAKLASGKPLSREKRGNDADAHLKRNATRSVPRDGPRSGGGGAQRPSRRLDRDWHSFPIGDLL